MADGPPIALLLPPIIKKRNREMGIFFYLLEMGTSIRPEGVSGIPGESALLSLEIYCPEESRSVGPHSRIVNHDCTNVREGVRVCVSFSQRSFFTVALISMSTGCSLMAGAYKILTQFSSLYLFLSFFFQPHTEERKRQRCFSLYLHSNPIGK